MDRSTWLAERRAAVVATYDDEAATYDDDPYPTSSHARFVGMLLETCPPGGVVLDAPCGTGRYFAQVVASGRRVVGIDQSSGMLAQSAAKGLAESLHRRRLQDLDYDHDFDAVMTIDALENVSPEDWPTVLATLHRAVRPGCRLYFTVEEVEPEVIKEAYERSIALGLPVEYGEVVDGDVAGYHFYPGRDRLLRWLADERLRPIEEHVDQEVGWAYRHLIVGDG
jgi:ubiquinone/menaquinone biosynthesis C-methylase UbiE